MGRLCGGANEISGIKAPLFLRGWVRVVGWWVVWLVLGWGVMGWVVVVGWVGCGLHCVLVRDIVGGGGSMGGGMGDSVLSGW